MLNIQRFTCNVFQENCYVVNDTSKECVIIDCGAFYSEEQHALLRYIEDNNLKPVHLIATHGHIDHHFGNNTLYESFGLQPEVHINDEFLMKQMAKQAEALMGIKLDIPMPAVGKYLQSADTIPFGNHRFTIIETPGHTPGSVVFYCAEEKVAFSGDTLFHHSIGRTDLEGGSMFQMIQSLRILSQLPDDTTLFPGHYEQTTIGTELAGNPYMDR